MQSKSSKLLSQVSWMRGETSSRFSKNQSSHLQVDLQDYVNRSAAATSAFNQWTPNPAWLTHFLSSRSPLKTPSPCFSCFSDAFDCCHCCLAETNDWTLVSERLPAGGHKSIDVGGNNSLSFTPGINQAWLCDIGVCYACRRAQGHREERRVCFGQKADSQRGNVHSHIFPLYAHGHA